MKNVLLGLLCIAAILMIPAISYGAPTTQEAMSEMKTSITVLGYGAASAAPDSVRISLHIGEEPVFGPSGSEMSLIELSDLEHVRDFLVEEGVDENSIEINSLRSSYAFGLSSSAGEIVFSYSELDRIRDLLQALLDELKERRGPVLQGANFIFRVDDCATLEEEAMRSALGDARQRATRMAGLLELSVSHVISVSEDVSLLVGGSRPSGGCIAREGEASPSAFTVMGGPGALANSPAAVEVAIMLKATFALE